MKNSGLVFVGVCAAIMLDVYGIICLGMDAANPMLGEMLSLIGDGIGMIFFSAWTAVINGKFSLTNKKAINKLIFTSLGEVIPYVGALPLWTIFAISEAIKSSKDKPIILFEEESEDENYSEDKEELETNPQENAGETVSESIDDEEEDKESASKGAENTDQNPELDQKED